MSEYQQNEDGTWIPAVPLNVEKCYDPWRHRRICRFCCVGVAVGLVLVVVFGRILVGL